MRRVMFTAALVTCMALVTAPALATGPPEVVGNPPAPELFEQRVSLAGCPEFVYVGEAEPFHILHGWLLNHDELPGAGLYTFELAVNGELLRPKYHNVVNPGADGGAAITRLFVFSFPEGLVTNDTVVGFWYTPDGLVLRCESTVVNGDPPG